MFLHSCVLPIHVNQTPKFTEIQCFQMLCFARAFLSYSCLFPIPALLESSNSNKPLHNYFCYRYVSKKTLCGLSCSCGAVFHPSSAAPTMEGFTTVGIRSLDCLSPPQIFFPSSDSQVSRSILTDQPNHAEIDMASPKRLYTSCGLT